MATHALIALQSHSSFHAAYLHFDGTPENLRPILHQHFNTIGKIKELIQPRLDEFFDFSNGIEMLMEDRPQVFRSSVKMQVGCMKGRMRLQGN